MKTRTLTILCLVLSGLPLFGETSPEQQAQALISEALIQFENEKFDAAEAMLLEAEKIRPDDPFILNLLGAIHTKEKDFSTAKADFDKALSIEPNFFPARFNLGELMFLQKQYTQALESFTRMLKQDPENALLQFKVILCLLLTDQIDEAKKLLKRMKPAINSPARYYAKAAIATVAGNSEKASSLVVTAQTLFPDKVALFNETFADLGWPTK